MEDCTDNRKRVRDDSGQLECSSPESKRVNQNTSSYTDQQEANRVKTETESNSPDSNEAQHESEEGSPDRNGAETDQELDLPEVKKIPEDILDILDDGETVPAIQDLDSVIRSFEEEILQSSPSPAQLTFLEPTSDSGESQPDLGYLLEASDDELGLPPTVSTSEDQVQNDPINAQAEALVGLDTMVVFEDGFQNYDAFESGLGERDIEGENFASDGNGDFVTVDGLFDYSEPSDFSDFTWRPESLSAL